MHLSFPPEPKRTCGVPFRPSPPLRCPLWEDVRAAEALARPMRRARP